MDFGDLRRDARRAVTTLSQQGARALYHLVREERLLRLKKRRDARPHILARLNLAAAHRGNALGGVLKVTGGDDIRRVTYGALDRREELSAALRALPLQDAIDLYQYFRYFDDFRTSSFLRTEMLQAHLRAQEAAAELMPDALFAALELGRPERALQLVSSKPIRGEDGVAVARAEATAHALRGEADAAERIWSRALSPQDRAFKDFVRGRSVAVVGPAQTTDAIRDEVDAFDIVVRPNFQGGVDPAFGSRTDVAYYNGNRLRSRRDEILAAAATLPWLITARDGDDALRQMFPAHAGLRSAERAEPDFCYAFPLAIPIMLADLVRFRPARIKLFCVDFFRSQSAYRQGYHHKPIGSEAIAHSLRVHDPFSSFRYVQELQRAGLCEADRVAGEVLGLDLDAYATSIHELYGPHVVGNQNPQ